MSLTPEGWAVACALGLSAGALAGWVFGGTEGACVGGAVGMLAMAVDAEIPAD